MPSIAGTASNFILNIVELQNVVTNISGTSPQQQLSNAVANMQKMVQYDTKTLLANNLSNYNTSPLQVQTSLNLASNASLTLNGAAVTGSFNASGVSTIGNGPSQQQYYSTTVGSDPAISLSVGAPSVTPMVVLADGQIRFPLAGTPGAGRYLTCMDGLGTAEWLDPAPPPSDARLKEGIRPLTGASEILEGLHGVRFVWKSDGSSDVGVIAQDVLRVLPEAVQEGPDGYYGVQYMKLIPVLIETVKELRARVAALEEEEKVRTSE